MTVAELIEKLKEMPKDSLVAMCRSNTYSSPHVVRFRKEPLPGYVIEEEFAGRRDVVIIEP